MGQAPRCQTSGLKTILIPEKGGWAPPAATQIQLVLTYRRLVEEKRHLPRYGEVGFKCHSQTDEDGTNGL